MLANSNPGVGSKSRISARLAPTIRMRPTPSASLAPDARFRPRYVQAWGPVDWSCKIRHVSPRAAAIARRFPAVFGIDTWN